MIRLNVFFTVSDAEKIKAAVEIGNQLVKESRKDHGCVAYGLFHSTSDEKVFLICETWADEQSLTDHSGAKHFVELVPRLESLSDNGLKLERFNF